MWRGDLTWQQMRAVSATLATTHERRIDIDVTDLNERHVGSLTPIILDGQVTIDAKADPTTPSRICDATFLDPDCVLDLEPSSITGAPLHRQFMLKVYYRIRVPSLTPEVDALGYGMGPYGIGPYGSESSDTADWVQIPVFTGPLWDFERSGAEVSVVAHGKERQALGNQWSPRPFKKKSKRTDAIRTLARDTGERRLSIPDLKPTLPDRFAVGPMDQPWVKQKRLARTLDRHLFYSADGVETLRSFPTKPCVVFDRTLLSEPTMKRSSEGVVNTFAVYGANPKGPKGRVHYVATLPANHASSPKSLQRNGEWLRLVLREENDHFKTIKECKKRAERLRDIHWTIANDYEFDALPDPRLEEYDMVAVETDLGRVRVQMLQWSIPLGMDPAPMHVGTIRRTTRARKKR